MTTSGLSKSQRRKVLRDEYRSAGQGNKQAVRRVLRAKGGMRMSPGLGYHIPPDKYTAWWRGEWTPDD